MDAQSQATDYREYKFGTPPKYCRASYGIRKKVFTEYFLLETGKDFFGLSVHLEFGSKSAFLSSPWIWDEIRSQTGKTVFSFPFSWISIARMHPRWM